MGNRSFSGGKRPFPFSSYELGLPGKKPRRARLFDPVWGAFIRPDILILADYNGPVIDVKTGRRGGVFPVFRVDFFRCRAEFLILSKPDNPFPEFKAGHVAYGPKKNALPWLKLILP